MMIHYMRSEKAILLLARTGINLPESRRICFFCEKKG